MIAECMIEKDGTVIIVLTFDDHNVQDTALRERLTSQGDHYVLRRRFSYLKMLDGKSESKTGLEFKVRAAGSIVSLENT
jgi:hypothetical protein